MVIDASALIAILHEEAEAASFLEAIRTDRVRLVSAVTKLEAGMVAVGQRGVAGGGDLDRLLALIGATIVPFDDDQANIAREAFARFGKGRHTAGLNFGDCASYALAASEAEPLLFKGMDFGATDVEAVSLVPGD